MELNMSIVLPKLSSQPSYKLSSKNKKLHDFLHNRVLSLSITDHLDTFIDELTLSFDNRSFKANLFIPPPNFGKTLELKLGYPPLLTDMGSFYIDSLNVATPPSMLNVTAKSINLLKGFLDKQTEAWKNPNEEEEKTIADVIKSIAKKYQLSTEIGEGYQDVPLQEYQYVESDIHFLSRLAKQYNAYFKIKQNKIIFKEYDNLKKDIKNKFPIILDNSNISSCQVEKQEADNYHSALAYWYDYDSASYCLETYPSGQENSEKIKSNIKSTGSNKKFTIREIFSLKEEAHYAAKAKYRQLARNKQIINLKCIGDSNLSTGKTLQLVGLQNEINGDWIIKHINHNYNASGFTTSINAYRFN